MPLLTVSFEGSVVIPADLRRKHDLEPGARIMLVDYGGVLALVPALEHPVEQAQGLPPSVPSLTQARRSQSN